jgi:hypothetical protein
MRMPDKFSNPNNGDTVYSTSLQTYIYFAGLDGRWKLVNNTRYNFNTLPSSTVIELILKCPAVINEMSNPTKEMKQLHNMLWEV